MTTYQSDEQHPAVTNVLRYFKYDHLPKELQAVSKDFYDLAHKVAQANPTSPETTVALRKLLEAKDAAVRAAVPETVEQAAQRGARGMREPE